MQTYIVQIAFYFQLYMYINSERNIIVEIKNGILENNLTKKCQSSIITKIYFKYSLESLNLYLNPNFITEP